MDNQQYDDILKEEKLQETRVVIKVIIIVLTILICLQQFKIFDVARMTKGISAIQTFIAKKVPPDFNDTLSWIIPVFDTLVMNVVETALAVFFSLLLDLLVTANSSLRAVTQ